MVRLLADPALSQTGAAPHEPAAKDQLGELGVKRSLMRTAPRRGWSMTDYRDDAGPPHQQAHGVFDRQAPIPEHGPLPPTISLPPPPPPPYYAAAAAGAGGPAQALAVRPRLPPPRRSYSATDKEPEPVAPGQPRPSWRMTILDLPSEVHYELFDLLDPIDGACLGLAHSRLYAIHRRKHGKVSLNSRYAGPNDMEWAWRGAGPLIRQRRQQQQQQQPAAAAAGTDQQHQQQRRRGADDDDEQGCRRPGPGPGLGGLRVQGQVYCRKCGVSRCELHRHLRDWMGDGYEYCEIRKTYGRPAGREARSYCFMSSPKNPRRCGRHGGRRGVDGGAEGDGGE